MHCFFSKYAGCGNDFLLIDNRSAIFPENKALIQRLCHRQLGVGADGIILLENSKVADYKMRIFNSNGSEAEMCGNGIRCLMKFILELQLPDKSYLIETMNDILTLSHKENTISVQMPSPTDISWSQKISMDKQSWKGHHLNTGVPHTVIFVDDVALIDVEALGPKIRFHPQFSPKGTNVNFATVKPQEQKVIIRTYERGVEKETLACGTGAVASALAAAEIYRFQSPICVQTQSQECLTISFTRETDSSFSNLLLNGPASFIFSGKISLLGFQLN